MNQTPEINELVAALAKAQGKMLPAVFNKQNSHFRQKYADFTSVMDACRAPLAENGLAVMQYCEDVGEKSKLVTMIAHTSGQWIKSYMPLIAKEMTSQGLGSAISYAKRYSLSAMLGIVSDEDKDSDDDGEIAVGRGKPAPAPTPPVPVPVVPKPVVMPINANQNHMLEQLHIKLSSSDKIALNAWIKNSFGVDFISQIPENEFEKVLDCLTRKLAMNKEAVNEKS